MNKYSTILLLILTTAIASFAQINFEECSIEAALVKAEKEHKKVFIEVYTSWCYPCQLMAEEVFSDPALGKQMAKTYISLKIDKEKSPYRKELSRFSYVKGYPTMLIVDAKGIELGRIYGRRNLEAFKKELQVYEKTQYHPVIEALNVLEQQPTSQAIWKENLSMFRKYPMVCYKHNLHKQYNEACQQYYQKFDLTTLEDAVDVWIFTQVKPSIEHPVAQFYVNDSIDYGSYQHIDYTLQDYQKKVKQIKTEEERNIIKKEVEAYYEYCFEAWGGDVSDKAYFIETVFNPLKEEETKEE